MSQTQKTTHFTVQTRLPHLSGTELKWIAILSMLLDHIGASLIEGVYFQRSVAEMSGSLQQTALPPSALFGWVWQLDQILRTLGRFAFPIFCFLLVEGFLHTRHFQRYCLRLLVFAFLSEIPFDLAIFGEPVYGDAQNVFFTLLTGLLVMWGLSRAEANALRTHADLRSAFALLPQMCILFAGFAAVILLRSDYDVFGILLIAILYMTRQNRRLQLICGAVICLLYSIPATLTFLLIACYDGTRGKGGKFLQYFFYAFYPLHLLLFGLLRLFLVP